MVFLLVVFLLMAIDGFSIGGFSINGHWWILVFILLLGIGVY
jgi:hypothetical protein